MIDIDIETLRSLFEEKMKMVKEQTGRDPFLDLVMCCGPEDAKIIYEKMFACFISGYGCAKYEKT